MPTSAASSIDELAATGVQFEGETLLVTLDDGQRLSLSLAQVPWLRWLLNATPAQRENWELEPQGFAVYWPDLDDGVEVRHLLEARQAA